MRRPSSNSQDIVSNNEGPSKPSDELIDGIKQVILIDDDNDSALTLKACLESYRIGDNVGSEFRVIEVTTYTDPVKALIEFKPYQYDLLLVDINMPTVSGYELVEKLTRLDFNIKVCFMSSGEVNYEATRNPSSIQEFWVLHKKTSHKGLFGQSRSSGVVLGPVNDTVVSLTN